MSGHHRSTVPVLTDVLQVHNVDETGAGAPMQEAAMAAPGDRWPPPARTMALFGHDVADAAPQGSPVSTTASTAEAALVARILEDVQRQVDLRIEHQLNAALMPAVEKLTATFASDARQAIAESLRDVVQRAVAQELERVRAVDRK